MNQYYEAIPFPENKPNENWYGVINQFGVIKQAYYKEDTNEWRDFNMEIIDVKAYLVPIEVLSITKKTK